MPVESAAEFLSLTPDTIVDAVETVVGVPFAGFTYPLNSYINRVYELMRADRTRIIAKFYRPGRWTRAAVQEEHRFMIACAEAEIPVVPPNLLPNGETLAETDDGILFAVFEKRRGREWEPVDDEAWQRLGAIVGRVHEIGARQPAPDRPILHPEHSLRRSLNAIGDGGMVATRHRTTFANFANRALAAVAGAFESFDQSDFVRLHGDCHQGNILHRPGEGLVMIDFDDMAMGPPVQDLWMLLPDRPGECRREINLILEGYEMFLDFDDRTLKLIEPLRLMRMLYFLAWVGRQREDPGFLRNFPGWGDDAFWRRELAELETQLAIIEEVRT